MTATAAGKDLMMAENTINGGLKLVDGPEVRAGRRDLFGVLQGAGNPYAEAQPKGDLWLQSMWTEGAFGSVVQKGHRRTVEEPPNPDKQCMLSQSLHMMQQREVS